MATGLRVASAKDDGAIWSIAKLTRTEADASRGHRQPDPGPLRLLDTAASGFDQISDWLHQLHQKALAYGDSSLGLSSKAAL